MLNALHDHAPDPVPAVLDAVRQVLGLGRPAGFDGAQLRQLAANPGGELVSRLAAYARHEPAFTRLASILPSAHRRRGRSPPNTSTCGSATAPSGSSCGSPAARRCSPSRSASRPTSPGITGASLTLDAVADTTGLRSSLPRARSRRPTPSRSGRWRSRPWSRSRPAPPPARPRVAVGLAVADGTGTRAALLSVGLDPVSVSLRTQTNGTDDPAADPGVVVTHVLVPLVADAALHEAHVQALLNSPSAARTLAELLQNVVLTTTNAFDTDNCLPSTRPT